MEYELMEKSTTTLKEAEATGLDSREKRATMALLQRPPSSLGLTLAKNSEYGDTSVLTDSGNLGMRTAEKLYSTWSTKAPGNRTPVNKFSCFNSNMLSSLPHT
jgi:hypothetical protein